MANKYVRFYPTQTGKPTPGMMSGSNGFVCGLEFQQTTIWNASLLVWQHVTRIDADIAPTYYHVYLDGELIGYTVDDKRFLIEGLRGGVPYDVNVLPLSAAEHDKMVGDPTLFDGIPVGNRVEITLPTMDLATDPDFSHYNIYWDNSREDANCDTLLAAVYGAKTEKYVTDILAEQDYSFCVKAVDLLGNESSAGATETITVETYPKQLDNEAVSYVQGTRLATLSGDVPAGQALDVVGYSVYSNHYPGHADLIDGLCIEDWAMISLEQPVGGSVSKQIPYELSEGNWRFAVRARDGNGHESNFTELTLNLALNGSTLEEIAAKPAPPIEITAVPNAGGTITVTCKHDGTNATHIRFYRDAVQDNDQAVGSSSTYTYTTAALVDGQEYDFTAVARNGTVLSELSDEVSATADSSAPGGSLAISLRLVY
jgi:hypothetical protein